MHGKLTLWIDAELIQRAEAYSRQTGKSLSQIVADYFARLTARSSEDDGDITPLVRSLRGSLRGAEVEESDYRRHLEEQYR